MRTPGVFQHHQYRKEKYAYARKVTPLNSVTSSAMSVSSVSLYPRKGASSFRLYLVPKRGNNMLTFFKVVQMGDTLVTVSLSEKLQYLYDRTCRPGTRGDLTEFEVRELCKKIEVFVDELAKAYSPLIQVGLTEQRPPSFGGDAFRDRVKVSTM